MRINKFGCPNWAQCLHPGLDESTLLCDIFYNSDIIVVVNQSFFELVESSTHLCGFASICFTCILRDGFSDNSQLHGTKMLSSIKFTISAVKEINYEHILLKKISYN